jgi:DNA-binding beta-propeller fold protein YncE
MTAQDAGEVKIVHGNGQNIETISFAYASSPHFVRFSNTGNYAYISRLGDGAFDVVRASNRQIVSSILIAPATEFKGNINPALPGGGGVHDATPNADGSVVLVTHWGTNRLYKLVGSEASETWAVSADISINGQRPICSVFSPTGAKAYVGLAPSGLAVIDVASMTVTGVHSTVGAIPCTQQNSRNGVDAYVISVPGRFYHLNMVTDNLTDLGDHLTQPHLHSMALNENEQILYASSRETDEIDILDLAGHPVGLVSVDATPNVRDKPDTLFSRGRLFVALRATGKLAIINNPGPTQPVFVDVATPWDVSLGYAVHGLAVRP